MADLKMTKGEKKIVDILVKRDGCTEHEAYETVKMARNDIMLAAEDGDYEEAEDIMYSLLGLEMDYLFDILY